MTLLTHLKSLLKRASQRPWKLCEEYIFSKKHNFMVAEVRGFGSDPEVQKPNGALIVTAVNSLPVLLEVIEKQQEALEEVVTMDEVSCSGDAVVSYCGRKARQALAETEKLLEVK